MPTAAVTPVSEHLKKIPAALRPTLQAACRTVKAVAPKAKEIAYRSWPIRYVVDEAYMRCSTICPPRTRKTSAKGRDRLFPVGGTVPCRPANGRHVAKSMAASSR